MRTLLAWNPRLVTLEKLKLTLRLLVPYKVKWTSLVLSTLRCPVTVVTVPPLLLERDVPMARGWSSSTTFLENELVTGEVLD